MSIYQYTDPTADQMEELFWSLLPVVAEQAGVTEADAFHHIRRTWADRIKGLKPHQAIDYRDDGRAATWRVRLTIWEQDSLLADTDDPKPLDHAGSTLLCGLPAVASWVRELVAIAHPDADIDGLSEPVLLNKIKSLRVALSNGGGESIWRLRYVARPKPAPPMPESERPKNLLKLAHPALRRERYCMAHVRIAREELAPSRRLA